MFAVWCAEAEWLRMSAEYIDFDRLARTPGGPAGGADGNWHYQCFLQVRALSDFITVVQQTLMRTACKCSVLSWSLSTLSAPCLTRSAVEMRVADLRRQPAHAVLMLWSSVLSGCGCDCGRLILASQGAAAVVAGDESAVNVQPSSRIQILVCSVALLEVSG